MACTQLCAQVIHRVSVAASPLAAWVKAIMAYSKVLEKTAPLEQELSGLMASLKVGGSWKNGRKYNISLKMPRAFELG